MKIIDLIQKVAEIIISLAYLGVFGGVMIFIFVYTVTIFLITLYFWYCIYSYYGEAIEEQE
jgi:hypothetical protein